MNIETSKPQDHLAYCGDSDGNIGLKVDPAVLFLDFKAAIAASKLLTRNLTLKYLTRPRTFGSQNYKFDANALEKSLSSNGHSKVNC